MKLFACRKIKGARKDLKLSFLKKAPICLFEKILDIIFPKQCVICNQFVDDILCDKCYNNLEITVKIDNYKNKNFKEHLYIFKYEGIIRKLLIDYKFNDKAYLSEFFVKIMLKNEIICRKIELCDIIIPVPIHKKRKNERGYNQSEIISRKIAKSFGQVQLLTNCLIKEKSTVAQSTLTKVQRKQNVKQVYKIKNKEKIKDKKILLFDDIYTTGSTVEECAKMLKQNGAKNILVLTIAKD